MNKAYLFAVILLFVPFTGCIEFEDASDNNSIELEEAVNDFVGAVRTADAKKVCRYTEYKIDYETNKIILANNTELNKCIEENNMKDRDYEYKITVINYTEENLDYKASNNSGFVYSVNMVLEGCERDNEFEPWECEKNEAVQLWVEVSGQWIWHHQGLDMGESAPIATFWLEESSGGYWTVEVVKVSKQEGLTKFSFFLKDPTGSTYVGGNGFGEIAMQIIEGHEHGIDRSYQGDDEQLKSRADNMTEDDGSVYPVHFYDNDRDGLLSPGDQFTVYGTGNSANGPAEDDWKLEIHYDPSGDIVGSARLM